MSTTEHVQSLFLTNTVEWLDAEESKNNGLPGHTRKANPRVGTVLYIL